jgi:NAD(P)-dependent dehydrogenase (short-subunit alcohol dehydrogenase family)
MTPRPDYGEESYKGYGRLKDKIALITGGDSGIGRAVAVAFAKEGADVAIQYLDVDGGGGDETKRVVEKQGKKCVQIPADFTKPENYKRVIDETLKAYGRIDLLINNAAYQGKQLDEFTQIEYDRVRDAFHVNIIAQFMLSKYAIPHMPEGSSIICTSSIQAYQPNPSILDYAATKGSVVTFVKGLAQELVSKGIRVNTVAPYVVFTLHLHEIALRCVLCLLHMCKASN